MAPTHGQDEQPRHRWPVNEPPDVSADDPRLASREAAETETRVLEKAGARTDEGGRLPGEIDFSTYVNEELSRRRLGGDASLSGATREDERAAGDRAGSGGLYRSGELAADVDGSYGEYDDTVLGLNYATVAPRVAVADERWASALRSFTRSAVWCLPVGAFLLALSAVFGWPTRTTESSLVSPGTWVVVTSLGLGLWLIGVVALAALVATSGIRPWGYVAVAASALGVALIGPAVGVAGLARPAINRTVTGTDDARIAEIGDQMQSRLLDHTVGRWLVVGGGVLLIVGAFAVAGAILGSRVLQRHDGWLVLLGIGIAILAAYLSWEFLFVLAAMAILAGTLGLAYTVSRLAPDGTPPPAY